MPNKKPKQPVEPVILRVWVGSEAVKGGSIHRNGLLFYPCEPAEYSGYNCLSYGWDGHGGADYHGCSDRKRTRQATDAEYAEFIVRYEKQYAEAGDPPLKRYRKWHPFMREEFERRQQASRKPKEPTE